MWGTAGLKPVLCWVINIKLGHKNLRRHDIFTKCLQRSRTTSPVISFRQFKGSLKVIQTKSMVRRVLIQNIWGQMGPLDSHGTYAFIYVKRWDVTLVTHKHTYNKKVGHQSVWLKPHYQFRLCDNATWQCLDTWLPQAKMCKFCQNQHWRLASGT